MRGTKRYKSEGYRTTTTADSWDDPEFDILQSQGDTDLFGKISSYMKVFLDIEEVKSDPAYNFTNELAIEMISVYRNDTALRAENKKFIFDSLKDETPEEALQIEISKIKNEKVSPI